MSEHLCASGAVEAAQRLWSHIINHPQAPLEHVAVAVARLIQTGGNATIAEAVGSAPAAAEAALTTLAAIGR